MAIIKAIKEIKTTDFRGKRPSTEVEAVVQIFREPGRESIVQIDTFGSKDRKIPGKVSQTIQFNEETARELVRVLKSAFNIEI